MAFFINYTAECDACNTQLTLKAKSKSDFNRRAINSKDRSNRWFADGDKHYCNSCNWPYFQDENGNKI